MRFLPATEDRPQIELVRSARRTRTISMQRDGVDEHGNPAYRLLIPAASTSEEIDEHIAGSFAAHSASCRPP